MTIVAFDDDMGRIPISLIIGRKVVLDGLEISPDPALDDDCLAFGVVHAFNIPYGAG